MASCVVWNNNIARHNYLGVGPLPDLVCSQFEQNSSFLKGVVTVMDSYLTVFVPKKHGKLRQKYVVMASCLTLLGPRWIE